MWGWGQSRRAILAGAHKRRIRQGALPRMKHFLGEEQTTDGRNQGNALLDRAGIERILPPYRMDALHLA